MSFRFKFEKEYFSVVGLLLYSVLAPLLGLMTLIYYAVDLQNLLASLQPSTALMYITLIGIPLTSLALLPSFGFAALIGFIYSGSISSYLLSAVCIAFSVFIGIFLAQRFSRELAENIFRRKEKWRLIYDGLLSKDGKSLFFFIFMIRISPHMPFALTNLLISQAKVSRCKISLFSWLGLLPRSLLAVTVGGEMHRLEDIANHKIDTKIGVLLTVFFILILIYKVKKSLELKV